MMHCAKHPEGVRSIAATTAKVIFFGLLAAAFGSFQAFAAGDAVQSFKLTRPLAESDGAGAPSASEVKPLQAHRPRYAGFERESASREARAVANWVVDSGDSQGMSFVIVDKKDAKVFVFNADGQLRGAAAALLGLAVGDDAVPGIGDRPLSSIRPEERTTPAGRFVAALDRNLRGKEILWVDYAGAVSLHPVVSSKPEERRLQRLATPTPLDNRISYGCINVPVKFFENVVRPAFLGTNGIVYVLPETRSAQKVFASYDVDELARLQPSSQHISVQAASPIDASLTR
ncbi:MAG: hypothetical protein QMD17_00990 [Rhodocyclaceae bacterium]|jgi:hypothetical protein|nr:hypothetical protein [Rhodocyclaceae bacterium]